jgi:hypothetical protein
MIEYFINQSYDKRKVKVTYLLYLRVVLVLTMVRFRPHHLRHHWSQISIFVFFFNHIHHHTYFKSSYVHIQVFHILHHHTIKLSQAFESFLLGRPIIEVGNKTDLQSATQFSSENWFAAAIQFGNENCFAASTSISVANHNFAAYNTTLTMNHKFTADNTTSAANHKFATTHTLSAANANSLQTTQF